MVDTITEPSRDIPVRAEVDVLVAGGGPGGSAAAIAAAEQGASTMLVERLGCLGGQATAALVVVWSGSAWRGGLYRRICDALHADDSLTGRTGGGYDVEACKDGEEVLSMYREAMDEGNPFAVVILDLTVPGGMGARETIGKLHELDPGAKGIVSSGYSSDAVLTKYEEHGFRGVIVKPYNIVELKDMIQTVIESD